MTKPNIKHIDFGAAAAMVETFAASRNIPTKQYPADQPAAVRAGEGASVPPRAIATEVVQVAAPVRRTPMRKFTIELPDYVIDQILMTSVTGKKTARHIIMTALRATNFTIHEEDMVEDGRRTRKAG